MQRYFRTSDILQEAAIQIIGEFRFKETPPTDSNSSWLSQVGRGHATRLRRRFTAKKRSADRVVASPEDQPAKEQSPDDIVERRDLWAKAAICLGQLQPEERTVIHEYNINERSFREIAEQMNQPEHWVKRTYHAAIRQLKVRISENSQQAMNEHRQ